MKLEVGMYVRTDKGNICKIIDYHNDITDYFYACYETDLKESLSKNYLIEENILKASHNLLGNDKEPCLIELGDYVNGNRVYVIDKEYGVLGENDVFYKEEDIESIVTKEQFKSISYEVSK